MTTAPLFSVEGLAITTPAGQVLLDGTGLEIGAQEIVLIVGRSASGKSTLANLLSGLLEVEAEGWKVAGTLKTSERSIDLSQEQPTIGALVFQRDALLDELTAGENLRIARDHAPEPSPQAIAGAGRLLAEIDPDVPVTEASGGMRQRIAIARTFMAGRPVLFLDEPNSGLDVGASRMLARTLREILDALKRPIVVVAHHVDDILEVADRVYLFDDQAKRLVPLPTDAGTVKAALLRLSATAAGDHPDGPSGGEEAWARALVRRRPSHWFFRYFAEYAWALSGTPLAFLLTAVASIIVGGVATWFGFNYRSFARYLIPLLHDETLSGLGIMLLTVGVPLVVSVSLAARNSAVVAADLCNRAYSMQFRAMRNLGIPGNLYIPVAIALAMLIGFFLLTLTSAVAASWASFFTWKLTFPDEPFEVWRQSFFRQYGTARHPIGVEIAWVAAKVGASGLASAAAAMLASRNGGRSPLDINRAVGHAIVASVLLTLAIHAAALVLHN